MQVLIKLTFKRSLLSTTDFIVGLFISYSFIVYVFQDVIYNIK